MPPQTVSWYFHDVEDEVIFEEIARKEVVVEWQTYCGL